MTRFQFAAWGLLFVLVVAMTILILKGQTVPALFVMIVGSVLQALFPSASNQVNVAAAKASIAPPPMPPAPPDDKEGSP